MGDSVLVIDDSESVREKIVHVLETRSLASRIYEAEDGLEGIKRLLAVPVDIVICDLEMPRMDGFKFLAMLKGRPEISHTPVIILTGNEDRELKIKGLEQGACDFLTKPFDPEELVARINVHLKIKHLQDDLKRSNELLLDLSNTDHLTGLYNRRYMIDVLEKEILRIKRNQERIISVIMLDIDHFKRINDKYGHLQGDLVLQQASMALKRELRAYDVAARYGGEELVAILHDTSLKEAFIVAERVRCSIYSMPLAGAMASDRITVSMGIASFPSLHYDDIDGLLRAADEALYQAKERGRNRVVLNDPESIVQ